jgi:hypothetical protein
MRASARSALGEPGGMASRWSAAASIWLIATSTSPAVSRPRLSTEPAVDRTSGAEVSPRSSCHARASALPSVK